jgi:peroxiredoxin
MLPLGTEAPPFELLDPRTGETVSLGDFAGAPALVVTFWCNHCPYVKHVRDAFVAFADEAEERGVGVVAICANDPEAYPEDAPDAMAREAHEHGYGFPYLHDATQEVARAFQAACTPDFFLFDEGRRLAYRGQFDDSRPSSGIPVTGRDLRAALDALLAGRTPDEEQVASIGCNIKWRKGNEPDYA